MRIRAAEATLSVLRDAALAVTLHPAQSRGQGTARFRVARFSVGHGCSPTLQLSLVYADRALSDSVLDTIETPAEHYAPVVAGAHGVRSALHRSFSDAGTLAFRVVRTRLSRVARGHVALVHGHESEASPRSPSSLTGPL